MSPLFLTLSLAFFLLANTNALLKTLRGPIHLQSGQSLLSLNLSGSAPVTQHNWGTNFRFSTLNIQYPTSVEEVQQIVKNAKKLRVVGTRHSFNKIADSPDTMLSTLALKNIISFDSSVPSITVQAGITYTDLNPYLRPLWGVMAINRLAHRWYVLLNVIYYILILMLLAAIGNAWICTDADYHKRNVLATPFLSSSSTKMLMVAISFWPISSVIFLKGNVGQMKNKTVESLSNIWIDFVLLRWGSNMWIHRTSCECFYCKRKTNNHLHRRQKLIEVKAKTQAESAVTDLFEALAGFGWFIFSVGLVWIYLSAGIVCSTLSDGLDRTIWGAILEWSVCSVVLVWLWSRRRIPENRPLNVTRTHAKPLAISRANDSGSENRSGGNNTDVKNKAHEMIANSSRAAAQDEAEAKELAKRRRDLKARMKTTPLDPDVKAQMQKEIEEIEDSRKELLESLEKNRESAAWISQVLDH